MNELIRQLALEAGGSTYPEVNSKQLETFARLIVKECLNNMENCDGDIDFAIWEIKKEFGIE